MGRILPSTDFCPDCGYVFCACACPPPGRYDDDGLDDHEETDRDLCDGRCNRYGDADDADLCEPCRLNAAAADTRYWLARWRLAAPVVLGAGRVEVAL